MRKEFLQIIRNFSQGHKDFSKVNKLESSKEINTFIDQSVKNNKVLLFMKGIPKRPMCGYSNFTVELLKKYQINDYKAINVLQDVQLKQAIKVYSNWPTFPQLYINGKLIGGSDILNQLQRDGQLQQMFQEQKVI